MRSAGVLHRTHAIQHERSDRDERRWLSRQKEPTQSRALGIEGLDSLLRAWDVGHDDATVRGHVEARRLNDSPLFSPDVHDPA
jgi:hypothetical protein